jgi:hypothetical protein
LKKKLLALVTGAALLAGTVSIPAYASANVTLVDITQQVQGSPVTIQGQSSFSDVLVKLIQPDNTILYFDDLIVTNGSFQKSFTLPVTAQLGEYKIVIGQGQSVAIDTFTVIASASGGNPGGGTPGGGTPGGGTPGGGTPGGGTPGGGTPGGGTQPGNNPTVPVVVKPGQSQTKVTPKSTTVGNTVKATLTDADLQTALSSNSNASVAVTVSVDSVNGQTAELTLSEQQVKLLSDATDATLVATTGRASVAVPSSLLKQVQEGASVEIVIGEDTDAVSTFTSQVAGATVVGTPVSYEINIIQNGGESTRIDVQSHSYIKRSFIVDGDVDITETGALYIENGVVHPVPATFTENEDGTFTVMVNRPGFSTYAVATRDVSFADINSSYAKDRIQTLADKFLVSGTTENTFSPKLKVTRAEFAALLGRAMGLQAKSAAPFGDVRASDWFAKDVAAAYEAGLVKGVGDGQFNPNAEITRQDLTVMLAKAIQLLNVPEKADAPAVSYSDASKFASYAQESIATVTKSGLMTGELVNGSYVFHPTDTTTREAAATVIYFLLKNAELIN